MKDVVVGVKAMAVSAQSSRLSSQIDEIREQRGDLVTLDDVAEVVHSLMASLEGDLSAADLQVHRELNEIVEFIRQARSDIAALQPQRLSDEHIVSATDELGAVVQATEEATSVFLDAAEQLENLAEQTTEEGLPDTLRDISTKIYEASSFQDITGQRITKVVSALRHIEQKVIGLASILDVRHEDPVPLEDPANLFCHPNGLSNDP